MITTKKGDNGLTTLKGNKIISKDSCLIESTALGDSLLSQLYLINAGKNNFDREIQNIKDIMSCITNYKDNFSSFQTSLLEEKIDKIKTMTDFINFQTIEACNVNEARTRCRLFERSLARLLHENNLDKEIFIYINRLSDWLFIKAISLNS